MKCWKRCFLLGQPQVYITRSNQSLHGGGFEYLHRNPASRSMRRKGNQVPGGIATLFLEVINTGTCSSRLEESRIWDSKIWSRFPWDLGPRMTALASTSSNCIQQTRFFLREGAVHQRTRTCPTETTICSWAPGRAWHQDRLIDWLSVVT
jgi:hypothetical protein